MEQQNTSWGEWMGSWKGSEEYDEEADRLSRQAAAFGADTLAKMKDINVLVIGMRGVGVETAKNLILSNVGSVTVHDPATAQMRDMGANFYITEQQVSDGTSRADACLDQLQTLNPYCRVAVHAGDLSDEFVTQNDVLESGKSFTAIVVTQMLPQDELIRLDSLARGNGMAFILAFTSGVTASMFSDFGPMHVITDADGKSKETLAIAGIEVLDKPSLLKVDGVEDGERVVVLSFASVVGYEAFPNDGATIVLDDLVGDLAEFSGKSFKVKNCSGVLPTAAEVNTNSEDFQKLLTQSSSSELVQGWQKQTDFFKAQFDAKAEEGKKFQTRTFKIMNRLVLVTDQPEAFTKYTVGGLCTEQKAELKVSHLSFADSLEHVGANGVPSMLNAESSQNGEGVDTHMAYAAVLAFYDKCQHWPRLQSDEDANTLVDLAKEIVAARLERRAAALAAGNPNEGMNDEDWASYHNGTVVPRKLCWGFVADPEELRDTDEARLKRFAKLFQAEITGFCAYLGGMAAQEVVKKTGKFTPFNQWIHHEDQALCTDLCGSNSGPTMGTRYDDQISILGKDFCNRAANMQVFMVGCGALGCEYMKALALMGVGTSGRGKVVVTDMDTIEVSNLSRQFLFRSPDVGNSKSKAGARVVGEWNTTMNIEGIEKFVGPSTEDYFNDEFWGSLDLCWNALDNVQARRYTDGRCLWYSKPLLESGTTGTESNHDVILPFRTKSYNDDIEPETTAIAMCTLRAAPYLPLHCIEYAKQLLFNDFFDFGPTQYESFRKDKTKWFNSLSELSPEEQRNALKIVSQMAISQQEKGCVDFGMCIQFAFEMLVSIFRNQVMDAIAAGDKEEENGVKYWTGTKRRPTAVDFNPHDAGAMEFLYAASNMYAFVFKVSYVRDRQAFSAAVCKLHEDGALVQKAHAASGDNVVQEGEEEVKIDVAELDGLTSVLKSVDTAKLTLATAHDFEKDDDSNFHIDFLTSATNLRAWNFGITETPRHRVKVVAGRIIAALATTTAMVCGLVDLEFCKLVLGLENLGAGQFLGSYTNLGLGLEQFNAFQPLPATVVKTNLDSFDSFTSWDKIEVHESGRTVQQLVSHLENTFQLNVHELSAEMDYNPKGDGPKTMDLWSKAEPGDKMLSDIFKSKCSSGAKQTSRSAGSKRRVQSELEKLCSDPLDGYTVAASASDSFEFNITLEGPPGSPYEGGLYLISLKLPDQYPIKAPQLVFNTSIEHMNILDGQPCPGLLGLSSWSPTSEVRGLLLQVAQLLKQPEPGDALRTDLSGMDREQYDAHVRKAVQMHATADQEFAAVGAAAEGVADTEPIEWFHDYLILRGSFTNKDGEEALLPRMKLSSLHESSSAAGPAAVEPVEPEIEAKVLAMALDLDDVELKPESCYKPTADRAARWATVDGVESLTVENTVVVTCKNADGQTIETLVNIETMEQYVFEDPIMCTCESIVHLVEAQFVPDGPWVMSVGSASTIEGEKAFLFGTYETFVSKESPECLKGLKTALQNRPVTTVYSGGGGLYGVAPHKGFSLRMPEDEIQDWTFIDDKGKVQPVPRPCCALRVWDASLRSYAAIDPNMNGAPVGPEAVDEWYVALIKKLKSSPYIGPELIDNLVTCEGYEFDANTSRPKDGSWRGKVQNRWTDLAVASNP